MNLKRSLRGRLATACVLLATIIGAVFALGGYIIVETIERKFIEERLTRTAQLLIQNRRSGGSLATSPQLTIAVDDEIPASLRRLDPRRQSARGPDRTARRDTLRGHRRHQ
jgi:hypothetical protein